MSSPRAETHISGLRGVPFVRPSPKYRPGGSALLMKEELSDRRRGP